MVYIFICLAENMLRSCQKKNVQNILTRSGCRDAQQARDQEQPCGPSKHGRHDDARYEASPRDDVGFCQQKQKLQRANVSQITAEVDGERESRDVGTSASLLFSFFSSQLSLMSHPTEFFQNGSRRKRGSSDLDKLDQAQ